MNPIVILLAVVGVLAVVVLILALRSERDPEAEIARRMSAYVGDEGSEAREEVIEEEAKRLSRLTESLDKAIEKRGFGSRIASRLAQASLKLTVTEYLLWNLISIAVMGGLAWLVFRNFLFLFGVLFGFFLPRVVVNIVTARRLKKFNDQLGDSLNLMVNSLRAGYSTMQALEVISSEMPSPISEEFGRVVMELQLGVTFDVAMANLLRRMPSPDMDLIITAMSVQREVGGNLAEVLDAISFTIRERVRIKGEIQTLTAQGRITGIIITFLPFALGGVVYMVNPSFMGALFENTCGWVMIGVALFLIVIGYFTVNKIVSIEI